MQESGTIIDYLASTMDLVDLPTLSGDEVSVTLDSYPEKFYTNMVQAYCNDPCIYAPHMSDPYMSDPYMSDPYVSPVTSPDLPPSPPSKKAPKKNSNQRKSSRKGSIEPNDEVNLEEIEVFRQKLKGHRIRRGLTQAQAAKEISELTNRKTSQTSLCRFENSQLHFKNMKALYPFFKKWVCLTSQFEL